MALTDKYQELMTLATRLEIRDFLVNEEGGKWFLQMYMAVRAYVARV